MWPFSSSNKSENNVNVDKQQGFKDSDASTYLKSNTVNVNNQQDSSISPTSAQDVLSIDPTSLHPMANVGDKLDYLLLDDDKLSELPGSQTALPSRGWSDDLCYGVGTTYVSG